MCWVPHLPRHPVQHAAPLDGGHVCRACSRGQQRQNASSRCKGQHPRPWTHTRVPVSATLSMQVVQVGRIQLTSRLSRHSRGLVHPDAIRAKSRRAHKRLYLTRAQYAVHSTRCWRMRQSRANTSGTGRGGRAEIKQARCTPGRWLTAWRIAAE